MRDFSRQVQVQNKVWCGTTQVEQMQAEGKCTQNSGQFDNDGSQQLQWTAEYQQLINQVVMASSSEHHYQWPTEDRRHNNFTRLFSFHTFLLHTIFLLL